VSILGIGRIGFWRGGSLWIGHGLSATKMHAHHAIQLCFGLDAPVRLRETPERDWTDHHAVLIPSMIPHALDARGAMAAALFCDPQSQIGRGLIARFGGSGLAVLPQSAELFGRIAAIGQGMAQGIEPETGCLELLAELAGTDAPRPATDPRVLKALEFVETRLDEPTSLSAAATSAALSPGRFRHLFVAEVGIPFRSYVLWLRLQHALRVGLQGASWTQAAHLSGFADSAHLSRTFRRMLGIAPTAIPRPRHHRP
jgi:AraC family transcriptional regulator